MRFLAVAFLLCLTACGSGSSDEPRLSKEPTLHLAKSALEQGNPGLALKVSSTILEHEPRNVDALTTRGDAYFAMHKRGLASRDYQQALRIDSASVDALIGVGRLRLSSDPAAAEEIFRKALDLEPRNVTALNDLGIACDMQNRHADAQANYRRAIALAPGNNATEVNLGLSLAMSGDKAGALELLQPLAADPEVAKRLRENLATALKAAGDPEGAARVNAVDEHTPDLQ